MSFASSAFRLSQRQMPQVAAVEPEQIERGLDKSRRPREEVRELRLPCLVQGQHLTIENRVLEVDRYRGAGRFKRPLQARGTEERAEDGGIKLPSRFQQLATLYASSCHPLLEFARRRCWTLPCFTHSDAGGLPDSIPVLPPTSPHSPISFSSSSQSRWSLGVSFPNLAIASRSLP